MILIACKKTSYVHLGEICKNIYTGADRLKFLTFVIPLPYVMFLMYQSLNLSLNQ